MRLWIVGNGFDRAHGLATGYSDYYKFLVGNGEEWMASMLEFYFGNVSGHPGNILWSQLEKALGIYSIDAIYDFLKEGHALDIDHVSQYVGEVEAEVQYHFVEICEKFSETFTNWCHSIELKKVKPISQFGFTTNDLFLTFNYTDTLEYVYGIDEGKVLHIHGRAASGDELIVGHNNPATMPKDIEDDFLDNTANIRAIVETVNKLEKKTKRIIAVNSPFFGSLGSIDDVMVYGHSIEEVDLPYFEEVNKNVDQNAKWTFCCYDESKVEHYKGVAQMLGLGKSRYSIEGQMLHRGKDKRKN